MPRFIYRARKASGEIIENSIDAENRQLVVRKLHAMQAYPISVVQEGGSGFGGVLQKDISLSSLRPISRKDVAAFTRQLSDLLKSGLTLAKALEVLVQQCENPKLRDVVKDLRSEVQGGAPFSKALADHPKVFPELYCSMVRAGEYGGLLDEVLERLADFAEEEIETRSKIVSAMAYPAIMVVVGILVIIVLITFVIPRFVEMFEGMDQELPVLTRGLMRISEFVGSPWFFGSVIAIVLGVIFGYRKLREDEEERVRIDRLKIKAPYLGSFIIRSEMARFARTLGTLLANGVPILKALEITRGMSKNAAVSREVGRISEAIREGGRLSERLGQSDVFPPIAVNMVAVGEETGSLEPTLVRVAQTYEKETERELRTLTSLIEPFMIIVMGGVVGLIVAAMILPIFQLSQGLSE